MTEEYVEEDVVYEELKEPHIIETGDSVKVKQVLDDATLQAIDEYGYKANYSWQNFQLFLMLLSCIFAMIAQFFPIPFPASRPLLTICCAMYFVISSVLQCIVSFIDKDTIMFTKPHEKFPYEMEIRTDFQRFQEYFTLIIQYKDKKRPQHSKEKTTGKMYVGKYFTVKGEFDEDAFSKDVQQHIQKFIDGKYLEIEYNHKMD